MMTRLWLAAFLGVMLGLGIAVGPSSIGMKEDLKQQMPLVASNLQPQREPASPVFQLVLAALAGILAAFPIFLLAKRHYG